MKKWVKRLTLCILAGVLLPVLAFCSGHEQETESGHIVGAPEPGKEYSVSDGRVYYLSLDLSQYVQLPQYRGLTVEVSRKQIEAEVETALREVAKYNSAIQTDKEIDSNDVAICTVTGTVNGKTFISESQAQIDVSLHDYLGIPGFADQLIGAKSGARLEMTVTLPSDYSVAEVAGKEARFEVNVGYVITPSLTDDAVKGYTQGAHQTIEEYRKFLQEQTRWLIGSEEIFRQLRKSATFLQYIDEAVELYYQQYVKRIEASFNGTLEEYLSENGFTVQDVRDMAKTGYEYNLLLYGLAQTENIQVYEGDYGPMFEELVEEYIYQQMVAGIVVSREDAVAYMTQNQEFVISTCLEEKVFRFLYENNTLREVDP